MKPRRSLKSLAGIACAAAVAALFVWLPAHAQIRQRLRTKDFSFPQFYEQTIGPGNPTNRLKMLVRGATGEFLTNGLIAVTAVRLEHYPVSGVGTNLVAVAPFALLDRETRTIFSTSRVDILADDGKITVHGDTGFQFEMTAYVLNVSNRTRTVINKLFATP